MKITIIYIVITTINPHVICQAYNQKQFCLESLLSCIQGGILPFPWLDIYCLKNND